MTETLTTTITAPTPEIRRWVLTEIEAGRAPDQLLKVLIERGISETDAVAFMTSLLETRLEELKARKLARELPAENLARDVPQPIAIDWPPRLTVLDREVEIVFSLDHPRVVVFRNLLSDQECDELIARSRDRISASEVIDMESGATRNDSGRTSSGTAFLRGETPLIERIERRIAALLKWPYEYGEALQILRYAVGEEYKPHYDYVDPAAPGAAPFLARGGQRVASLVMYLNTPEDGGGTNFPDIGLEIAAHKGSAVFFSYDRPHPVTRSRHGGMPVRAGEKWVATKWLREAAHT